MLTRTPHWATREFHDFLNSAMYSPFSYGTQDCCTFAADAIKSFTGFDIAQEFRGAYKTKVGALKAIKQISGGTTVEDVVAYVANKYGLKERIHPLMCQRGDLVIFEHGDDILAGVVHLNGRSIVSVSDSGTVILPVTQVKRSWSV